MEWIAVKDKPPDVGHSILGYLYGEIVECSLRKDGWYQVYCCGTARICAITHWMELPESPECL